MSRSLPIALMQVPSSSSLENFESYIKEVTTQFPATEIVVFPELHLTSPDENKFEKVPHEPLPGPRSKAISQIAKKFGVWLIPGSVFEDSNGSIFNTLPVFSPTGDLVASYRKIFPWRPYEKVRAGNEIVYFDIPNRGRVGLTVCYDAWFPEIFRQLSWFGCDAIINVVLTPTVDREQELILAQANAIVNQVFIISVNAASPSAVGQSLIVDPEGRIRSHAIGGETTVITDVIHMDISQRTQSYGTAGLNCLWNQFQAGDSPIDLPIYNGSISPDRWRPQTRQ